MTSSESRDPPRDSPKTMLIPVAVHDGLRIKGLADLLRKTDGDVVRAALDALNEKREAKAEAEALLASGPITTSIPVSVSEALLINGLAEQLGKTGPEAILDALKALVEVREAAADPSIPVMWRLEGIEAVMRVTDSGNRRAFEIIYESVEDIRSQVKALTAAIASIPILKNENEQ